MVEISSRTISKTNALRYKYGLLKETKTPKERNKYPNTGFATNNFMIDSEVFEIVQFNESLKTMDTKTAYLDMNY